MMTKAPDKPNGTLYAGEPGISVTAEPGTIVALYNECHAEDAMTTYLHELYAHQEWADAEHWRAFEAYPAALADQALRERLHHIHLVQSAFLWVVGPRSAQFVITKVEDCVFSAFYRFVQYLVCS
jgi:hypothetical protein